MKPIVAVGVLVFSISGCVTDNSEISHYSSAGIKQCASSEAVPGSQIIYTGPTGAGPGSEWQQLSGNLMVIGALPTDIWATPNPDMFAPVAADAACTSGKNTQTNLGATFGVDVKSLPVSGSLKASLVNATVISTTADGFEWDWVKFTVFNSELAKLPENSVYRGHNNPSLMVAIGMLKVNGYTATVDVSKSNSLNLGASYSGPLPKELTGALNAGVTATYDGKGNLQLKIPTSTYVAGVFRPLSSMTGQVASGSATLAPSPFVWQPTSVEVQGPRR